MKQVDVREGARRQHRVVSLFAVIQCWLGGVDGVGFERSQLERLLGLAKFKAARVDWLKEDFKEFFPYWEVYWRSDREDSLSSIVVARKPINEFLPSGTMTLAKRIAGMLGGSPKIAKFQLWPKPDRNLTELFEGLLPFFADRANFDERFLSAYLGLLAQGQISPRRVPPGPSKT